MGRHGAPSASLGSGSARAPPEAGQVRATRRSDAIPRPRAGCPAPGPFALAQSASPAAAPGTGSSPKEEVRLDSLGGWCLRHQCVTGGGQRMSE